MLHSGGIIFAQIMREACEAKHFSSDINLDTLLYSESDGSISVHTHEARRKIDSECDALRKYVKYYPPDNLVFTTTDASGLRIWDQERQKVLYKYKEEQLYDHSYSQNYILASFDDYNIKFYDLKCRYLASSRPFRNNKKVGWIDEYVYCFDGEHVSAFDYRNLDSPVHSFDNVFDFAVCDGVCYLTTKVSGKYQLIYTDPRAGDSYLKKEVPYGKIFPLKGHGCIAGVTKDGLRVESYSSLRDVGMKGYNVEALHFGSSNGYCFANGFLFIFAGSLEDFCAQ